jgi:hypothetical protein
MIATRFKPGCLCGRRLFLQSALALTGGLLLPGAQAAEGAFRDLQGGAFVNQRPASLNTPIRPGDTVTVAQGGRAALVLGNDAYLLRGGSTLQLQGLADSGGAQLLRLITGGLLSVFGRGQRREIVTRTATIGIRGTAVYLESRAAHAYFCACYGEVDLNTPGHQEALRTTRHGARDIYLPEAGAGVTKAADVRNHDDDELRFLEGLVGRKPAFDA